MCNIVHFCCVYTRHDSDLTAGIENELDMTILLFCISRIKSPDTCSSISRAAYAMKIIYIYIYIYIYIWSKYTWSNRSVFFHFSYTHTYRNNFRCVYGSTVCLLFRPSTLHSYSSSWDVVAPVWTVLIPTENPLLGYVISDTDQYLGL